MDIVRAKELLRILADGINPVTGEILPEEDSCNQVEIVRALNIVLRENTIPPVKETIKQEKGTRGNRGKAWTKEDDRALCEMFDMGCSAHSMSMRFQRSIGGIAARLVRLGKIEERSDLKKHR